MSIFQTILGKALKLNAKVAFLGIGSASITAVALVGLAVWQSGQYNTLAQGEVDELIDADMDHIAQGIYNLVQTENEAVQQQVDGNLNVARHVLANAGGVSLSRESIVWTAINQLTEETVPVQLPKLLIGGQWLGQNTFPDTETAVVDEVTRLVDETATIFQRMNAKGDMLRVATTVKNKDGQRAIGTYIPAVNPDHALNPVIAAIMKGQTYHGRAFVVDAWNLTAYAPITDAANNPVGMLYVGVKQKSAESRVRQAVLQTKVGKTGYVYVLGGQGNDRGRYIISQRGERDGEDIWENRDSDGRYMIQEIVDKATILKPGELATVRYRWQNPGERAPCWKIARLAYYKPWDWVIGVSAYEDELQTYRAVLSGGRTQMTRIMGLVGLALTLLIGLLGIFFAWTITRPVRAMTKAMETIARGDLSQRVDVHTRDEIGALAQTFNLMTKRLQQTIEDLHKSERFLANVIENIPDMIFVKDAEQLRFVMFNKAGEELLGSSREEMIGKNVHDLFPKAEADFFESKDREVLLGKRFIDIPEETVQTKLKGQRILHTIKLSILDKGGNPQFLMGISEDITERRRLEESLQKIGKMHSLILDNSTVGIAFVRNRIFEWVNPRMCELFGLRSDQFQGASMRIIYPSDEASEKMGAEVYPLFTQGKKTGGEIEMRRGDGSLFWYRLEGNALDTAKPQDGSIWVCEDITERKRAEEESQRYRNRLEELVRERTTELLAKNTQLAEDIAERKRMEQSLQETSNYLNNLLDYANAPIIVWDSGFRITRFNHAFEQLTGRRADEALGQELGFLFPADRRQECLGQLQRTTTGERWEVVEIPIQHVNGTVRTLMWNSASLFEPDGQTVSSTIAQGQDITERKRAEEALKESKSLIDAVIEHVPLMIFLKEATDLRFLIFNRAGEELLGYDRKDLLGKNNLDLFPPEQAAHFMAKDHEVLDGETGILDIPEETIMTAKKGQRLLHTRKVCIRRADGTTKYLLGISEDITERKMLDAQMLQHEKLESIGQLAAGIAHEINTPIQYIGDHARFLKEGLQDMEPLLRKYDELILAARAGKMPETLPDEIAALQKKADLEYFRKQAPKAIDQALEGVNRVATIVRAMKDFSHPGPAEMTPTDINRAIESTVTVCRNEWKYVADLRMDLDEGLPSVTCIPGEINQVILNMVVNAAHAIGDAIGKSSMRKGRIVIRTRADGDAAKISIADTGTGIAEEHRSRIFDPFFTTKAVGKGTGQGLTIAYNVIVKKHGGKLDFDTEVGKGTTFHIRLPLAGQEKHSLGA